MNTLLNNAIGNDFERIRIVAIDWDELIDLSGVKNIVYIIE